ncbi:MAG: ShlB/FhaC/HecB family hemolysin secretion/activation protein [Sterolibacterium sp.]
MNLRTSLQHAASAWLFGLALTLSPFPGFAADADHLNVQEPQRPSYLPTKPPETFQLPPVTPDQPAKPAAQGETVVIRQIAFRGNNILQSDQLMSIAAGYLGRPLSIADLEELRQKITKHYVDLGYINSGAVFGKDAIEGDSLNLDIIEGRVQSMRLGGLQRLNEAYVVNRLVKDSDPALNIDVLRERFQLLLDNPLFERINARLMPGARLGEALLDIDVVRARPYQLSVFANNYRPPSIGANAYGVSGWVRNLTGYGDLLEASYQDASRGEGGGRGSLGWHMPINQSGTQLSLQLDHGRSSIIEQPMQVLDIKSTLDSKDLGISQIFIENLRHKLTLGLNAVERENRTSLLGAPFSFTPGEPDGLTKVRALRFWQEYNYRAEKQVLALRSTFSFARNNTQKINSLPGNAPQSSDKYDFWLGQVQYGRQLLENGAQVVLRASVQHTQDTLVPLDRMSIGGVFTVRGYRENQMIRDTGRILSAELDYPLVRNPGSGLNLSLIPFYDFGQGKNIGEAAETITSLGLASRLRWQGISLDLVFAKRLAHPSAITNSGGTLQDHGVHLQLGYDFF